MAYQNFFATRLYTDIGASDTTITLENPPSVTSGRLVLEARNTSKREIISYTGVSGNDITGVTRGVGGTSATDHSKNSLVEMNVTAEDLTDALNVPNDIETRFDETISDHVASGLIWTDDIGLTADMSAGVAYINGIRLDVSAVSGRTFTASKDTYVDLGDNGTLDYNEVANGASAPAIAANHLRLAKVVTDGTDTTGITLYTNSASLVKADGWQTGLPVPDTITYNGNRSYDLVFNSNDLTDTVSNGMRVKLTRTVTPPTQCTDLESGSSQYWSKTSPAGTTFTDDFCVGAWIKLESYGPCGVVSRYNGTSGWIMAIDASGIVQLTGYNAASGNYSRVQSYQSVPLNKWVHVAAQLDMSTFTATTTTSYIMIDGVNVPAQVTRAGTNPTALVQAGNLEIGSWNGGTNTFDGKIAQAWYSNAKITQSTIQTFISQGMTGSETSIVSHFDFNGDGNDNNANANNLTANGGATATTVDSPFNATEYGIITANSFSTNTTLTVQVPEGYAIPTSGGVSAVSYSTQDVPYGFPRDKAKWDITSVNRQQTNQNSTTTFTTFANVDGHKLIVPIGAWDIMADLPGFSSNTNSNEFVFTEDTITGNAVGSHTKFEQVVRIQVSAASTGFIYKRLLFPYNATSATTFKLWNAQSAGTTTAGMDGDNQLFQFTARLAYV